MSSPPSGRSIARANWHRIATGQIDAELQAWVVSVAEALVLAERVKDPHKRKQAIARAVGLDGKLDETAHALRKLNEASPETWGATPRERSKNKRVTMSVVLGHAEFDERRSITPEALRKRIARAIKPKP